MRQFQTAMVCALAIMTFATPAMAQSITARQIIENGLRQRGITTSQMRSQMTWSEYSRPVSADGFTGLEVSYANAAGDGVSIVIGILRNNTSKPYCIAPILRFDPSYLVKFLATQQQVVEPGAYAELLSAQGRGGESYVFTHGIAYWPARTDVTEGRCRTIEPEGLASWKAAAQPRDFWNSRR